MTWTPDEAYLNGLHFMTRVVTRVPPGSWSSPSPCEGWQADDVLGHVGMMVRYGTDLLTKGEGSFDLTQPPRSGVAGDPGTYWQGLVGPARDSLKGIDLARVVDTPLGQRPVGEGLAFPAADLFVHAWDIGRSVDLPVTVPEEAIAFAHAVLDPIGDNLRRPGLFAAPVPAGQDVGDSDAFLAWTGRDPNWVAG